jgi:hypothetical protein
MNTSDNLNKPVYCTIKEFLKACPEMRRRTLARHIKEGRIEARRIHCSQVPQGYKYEVAVYDPDILKRVLQLRAKEKQNKLEQWQTKRTLKKVMNNFASDISEDISKYLNLTSEINIRNMNQINIKNKVISLVEERLEKYLSHI